MNGHFDICCVFEISKFDIARLTCICEKVYFDQLLDFPIFLYYSFALYYFAIFYSLDAGFFTTIRVSNSLDPDEARHFSSLIWVQTVFKGYQQTTKVASSSQRVKYKTT